MNPIRVCMISYHFPPVYSGAGRQAQKLAQALQAKGLSVSVLTARHRIDLPAQEVESGVVVRLPVLENGRLRPFSFAFLAGCHLLRHFSNYDLIHIHGAYWRLIFTLPVVKLIGKKSIVKISLLGTDDPSSIRQRYFGYILYRTLALADSVISISQEISRSYHESGLPVSKLAEIPNGVNTKLFSPADRQRQADLREQLNLPPNVPLIIFVGDVCYRKGVDLLLKAWRDVLLVFPSAWLLLVGPVAINDPDQPLNVPSITEFLADSAQTLAVGYQEEVKNYLGAADIFTLPSRQEGLPNAVIEAMAVGLPCVASDIEGNVDLIHHAQNGLLFESESVNQLSEALIRLLNNPSERNQFGRQARKTIETDYSMESVTNRYIALYDSLLDS